MAAVAGVAETMVTAAMVADGTEGEWHHNMVAGERLYFLIRKYELGNSDGGKLYRISTV